MILLTQVLAGPKVPEPELPPDVLSSFLLHAVRKRAPTSAIRVKIFIECIDIGFVKLKIAFFSLIINLVFMLHNFLDRLLLDLAFQPGNNVEVHKGPAFQGAILVFFQFFL